MDGEPAKPPWRTLLGLAISLTAIAGCVWWASRQQAPPVPTSASSLALVAAAVGVYAVAILGRGLRWETILGRLQIAHRPVDAYGLNVVGLMGNNVLPARGGDILRIFLLAERSHARRREVLGSLITERVLDLVGLAILAVAVAALGVGHQPGGAAMPYLLAGGLALLAATAFLYLRARRRGRFERFAGRVRPVARASRVLLTTAGVLLACLTVAVWCLDGVVFLLGAHALGVKVGLAEAVFVVVVAGVSAVIPAGPANVGTYDAAMLYCMTQVGITGGDALGGLLAFRFVAFVPVTLVGLVLMITRYGGWRRPAPLRGAEEAR